MGSGVGWFACGRESPALSGNELALGGAVARISKAPKLSSYKLQKIKSRIRTRGQSRAGPGRGPRAVSRGLPARFGFRSGRAGFWPLADGTGPGALCGMDQAILVGFTHSACAISSGKPSRLGTTSEIPPLRSLTAPRPWEAGEVPAFNDFFEASFLPHDGSWCLLSDGPGELPLEARVSCRPEARLRQVRSGCVEKTQEPTQSEAAPPRVQTDPTRVPHCPRQRIPGVRGGRGAPGPRRVSGGLQAADTE